MNKKEIRKYVLFTLGSFIMGVGIAVCEQADLGVDPMSVLILGLYKRVGVSFGVMNFIVSLAQLIIGYLLEKKNVTMATFIGIVGVSLGIDAYVLLGLPKVATPFNYLLLVGGLILYCGGVSLSQLPVCGYTAYDCLLFGIMHKTKCKYPVARWAMEIFFMVSGFLLGGPIGICTAITMLFAGKIIVFFNGILEKTIKID